MFPSRTIAIFLFFALIIPQDSTCKRFDVNKFIEEHSTCNGDALVSPPDWIPKALLAATNCFDVTTEYCSELCLAFNIDGFISGKKIDTKWMKKEARRLSVSSANEKAKQRLIDAVDVCTKPNLEYIRPTSDTTSCPEWKKFEDCMDDAYSVACNGKKPKSGDEFLDE